METLKKTELERAQTALAYGWAEILILREMRHDVRIGYTAVNADADGELMFTPACPEQVGNGPFRVMVPDDAEVRFVKRGAYWVGVGNDAVENSECDSVVAAHEIISELRAMDEFKDCEFEVYDDPITPSQNWGDETFVRI